MIGRLWIYLLLTGAILFPLTPMLHAKPDTKHGLMLVFKTERIHAEFFGWQMDNRLLHMMLRQAAYTWDTYREPLEITEIYRTHDEQILIYPHGEWRKSSHEDWRAYDAVVRGLDGNDHRSIEMETNRWYQGSDTHCLYHNAGSGPHLHNAVPILGGEQ